MEIDGSTRRVIVFFCIFISTLDRVTFDFSSGLFISVTVLTGMELKAHI